MEKDSPRRPKSAMRDRSRSSRVRTLTRRVSFSSPEAIHIDDDTCVRQPSEIDDVDPVVDDWSPRLKGDDRYDNPYPSSTSSNTPNRRGNTRAETPGPPSDLHSSHRSLSHSHTADDNSIRDDWHRRPRTPSHSHSVNLERERHR